MSVIAENLDKINQTIPDTVKLIAVSKTKPIELLQEVYDCGHKLFGENKVQELADKYEKMPKDIEWHFIGHLQTNKVKYIAPFVSLIHGVDSLKLLSVINKEAVKNNRIIPCLLQFHIASEETKFGLDLDEAKQLLESDEYKQLKNISIHGVMGMTSYTEDENVIHNEFRNLKHIFDILKQEYFENNDEFKELSMGMSGDFIIAIEEGSTMIRVGSSIFGERIYN